MIHSALLEVTLTSKRVVPTDQQRIRQTRTYRRTYRSIRLPWEEKKKKATSFLALSSPGLELCFA